MPQTQHGKDNTDVGWIFFKFEHEINGHHYGILSLIVRCSCGLLLYLGAPKLKVLFYLKHFNPKISPRFHLGWPLEGVRDLIQEIPERQIGQSAPGEAYIPLMRNPLFCRVSSLRTWTTLGRHQESRFRGGFQIACSSIVSLISISWRLVRSFLEHCSPVVR